MTRSPVLDGGESGIVKAPPSTYYFGGLPSSSLQLTGQPARGRARQTRATTLTRERQGRARPLVGPSRCETHRSRPEAEDVILIAGARIREEIAKAPKAKPGLKKLDTAQGKQLGRKDAMPSGTRRARLLARRLLVTARSRPGRADRDTGG
jgi:hypothetical protein